MALVIVGALLAGVVTATARRLVVDFFTDMGGLVDVVGLVGRIDLDVFVALIDFVDLVDLGDVDDGAAFATPAPASTAICAHTTASTTAREATTR